MKFSITRLFDLSSLLATKAGSELKDFVEYSSQLQDQVLRLSQNQVTIDDNMKAVRKTLTVKNGQTEYEIFGLPSGAPALVVLNTSDAPLDNPFQFNWRYDGRQGKVKVFLKPSRALAAPAQVELVVFFR